MEIKDADGKTVSAGDTIGFSYGIPAVSVDAAVVEIKGALWALTPGHNPPKIKLSQLAKHVGSFWKEAKKPARKPQPGEQWDRRATPRKDEQ